jgi:hypothetical protein
MITREDDVDAHAFDALFPLHLVVFCLVIIAAVWIGHRRARRAQHAASALRKEAV